MCGLAGIFRFDGHFTRSDVEAVLRMLDAQVHRGPDDWGILLPDTLLQRDEVKSLFATRGLDHVSSYENRSAGPAVILGSRRLSILDLSIRGRMPLSNTAGCNWVTHNGEIYNSPALREELQTAGFTFRSASDTEVLINGYDRWGDDFVSHLRGMFAFGLFDSASSRLVLARDRFGIKPLYYAALGSQQTANGNALIFASEVRAIKHSNLIADEPEPEAAIRFLQLGSIPTPLTTVKNVFALPAGHMMLVGPDDTNIRRYWSLTDHQGKQHRESSNEDSAVADTRRLLDQSVQQHLLSDVPLGIFLSGGIDSSALVALAASFRAEPLTTLSIVFDEPEYDESKYARLIADKYQTSHCETLLRSQELLSELPNVFAAMDQPTVDGVNSFFVSRAAKQAGLKVVLSGLGGDEVFLGYSHLHKAHSLNGARRLFATVPAALRKGLVQLAIPAGTAAGRSGLEKLAYLEDPSSANMYLMFRGLFVPRQIQKLLGLSDVEMKRYGVALPAVNGSGKRSLLDSFVSNEFDHYLQNQLLKDTDCMSMAHSIETRVPFLDHKLVEHAVALPVKFKLNGGTNKPLLIKALGDDLPREIWDRPKMGFTFPFGSWLRNNNDAYQTTESTAGILDKREVEKVWTAFREQRFHWSRPWALMVLEQFAKSHPVKIFSNV
ncbi:MAG TPA: asparagine synthase (glutamine-hydrolyzing) [Pyrinomonadaceae bacterium]|nr:asparagine synthase (glutamine-hydrolyzing) [Pyrinomonadaceae bacterium]